MTFTAEQIPAQELQARYVKCRTLLAQIVPQASGMLIFSRTNIYYLTGTRANGILWLPQEGDPVLMVRKAVQRCQLESPLRHIVSFKSYAELPHLCADAGAPLGTCVGAEMQALSWSLATMLQARLQEHSFIGIDALLAQIRFGKSPYERQRLHQAAQWHHKALTELLPQHIHPGMSEQHISHILWKIFFSLGHGGMLRKENLGAEMFLGSIATGKNTLYPPAFDDMSPYMGEHPAAPHMGYAGSIWQNNQHLVLDTGFVYEGYHSHCAITLGAGPHMVENVHKAYTCCAQVLQKIGNTLRPTHLEFAQLHSQAQQIAQEYAYQDALTFSVHGVGLSIDESLNAMPYVAKACTVDSHPKGSQDMNFPALGQQEAAMVVLSAAVRLENVGTVSLKALYEVEHHASHCLTPLATTMPQIHEK